MKELFRINLNPKITVCDQGTTNQCILKSLNVSLKSLLFFVDKNF